MPKYRMLTDKELKEMRQEFIEYLVVNGITGDEWQRIKKEETDKAEKILELFSDVVLAGALRKVQYLEHKGRSEVLCFQFLEDKILLVGLRDDNPEANLENAKYVESVIQNNSNASAVTFATEKEYSKEREMEIFEMTMNGGQVTEGQLFRTLQTIHHAGK